MREAVVENEFIKAVREAGGMALKFTSQTMNGVPDRLILFKIGKCAFVELKAPGKQMRPLQRKRRHQLESLGFPVFCVDRLEQIKPVIDALLAWNPGEPFPTGVGAPIPELKMAELPGDSKLSENTVPSENTVLSESTVLPENSVLTESTMLPKEGLPLAESDALNEEADDGICTT